jgi:hypothetical protein
MPAKRRTAKRRTDPAAELEAWSMLFRCGYDFFGDLDHLGLDIDAKRRAAREAWRRLGAAFMTAWRPDTARQKPWALEQFGDPKCR